MRTKGSKNKVKKVQAVDTTDNSTNQVSDTIPTPPPVEVSVEAKKERLSDLVKQFKAAQETREQALRQVQDAKLVESNTIKALVEEFGTNGKLKLNIGGKEYSASHRGDNYFVKSYHGDVISIDE